MTDKNVVTESNLPVGTTTDKLATVTVTQADGTVVHREEVLLADPVNTEWRINLEPFDFSAHDRYALPVTGPEIKDLCYLMKALIEEVQLTNLFMSRLAGEELIIYDIEDR